MYEKIIVNGQLQNGTDFNPDDRSDKYIYEVIRIIDGKVLFAEQHYSRLSASLKSLGQDVNLSLDSLCEQIHTLARANNILNDNVKLIADNFRDSSDYDVFMFIIGAHYPSSSDYKYGVATELFEAVRPDPHIKVRNQPLRDATNKIIADHGLFEVILVDESGHVTEGSRSNIFFIKGGAVYTSPADAVLLGVTRKEIIQACLDGNIQVLEEIIEASSIDDFDAAFISGTSPKVLPISRIGKIKLDINNETLRRIMALYDERIKASLV